MGSYNTAVITTVGQALLTSVLGAQGTMTFTKLQTSSYAYASGTDLSALTSLNNVEQEANVGTASIIDSTHIAADATISNTGVTTEYNANTLGIFATDGNSEVLFAVSTAVTPDVIPVDSGGTPSTYKYKFTLAVSSTSDITISAVGDIAANDVSFDNTTSGLPATEVQTAIDTIDAEVDATRDAGAVNKLVYPYEDTTKVENGITYTDIGNGIVNVNGTASGESVFVFNSTLKLAKGTYIVSTEDAIPSNVDAVIQIYNTSHSVFVSFGTDAKEATFTLSQNETLVVRFKVNSGYTLSNFVLKPMIRDARITDDTWQPYAKTNRELTTTSATQDELSNLVLTGTTNTSGATISEGTCFVLNGDFVTAKTAIASGATFTLNTNYEKKSVGEAISSKWFSVNSLNANVTVNNVAVAGRQFGEIMAISCSFTVSASLNAWADLFSLPYYTINFTAFIKEMSTGYLAKDSNNDYIIAQGSGNKVILGSKGLPAGSYEIDAIVMINRNS